MRALQSLYSSQIYEKEAEKSCVFRLDLKACKVLDDITSDDRLIHVFATTTGKARSPIVQSRVGGTDDAEVEDERSRSRPGI